jgi:hypothetical protein
MAQMANNRKISINSLFKAKEKLHKDLARLSFEKKIEMLFDLQKIAGNFKVARFSPKHT